MGKASRDKGRRFEIAIARDLRAAFPSATVRRSQQADRAYEPDVVIEGVPRLEPLWLELTHSDRPNVESKLNQAERDAYARCVNGAPVNRWPAVVWRRTSERAIHASMRARTYRDMVGWPPHTGLFAGWNDVIIQQSWHDFLELLKWRAGR